jgi:hypothetical protein
MSESCPTPSQTKPTVAITNKAVAEAGILANAAGSEVFCNQTFV